MSHIILFLFFAMVIQYNIPCIKAEDTNSKSSSTPAAKTEALTENANDNQDTSKRNSFGLMDPNNFIFTPLKNMAHKVNDAFGNMFKLNP